MWQGRDRNIQSTIQRVLDGSDEFNGDVNELLPPTSNNADPRSQSQSVRWNRGQWVNRNECGLAMCL